MVLVFNAFCILFCVCITHLSHTYVQRLPKVIPSLQNYKLFNRITSIIIYNWFVCSIIQNRMWEENNGVQRSPCQLFISNYYLVGSRKNKSSKFEATQLKNGESWYDCGRHSNNVKSDLNYERLDNRAQSWAIRALPPTRLAGRSECSTVHRMSWCGVSILGVMHVRAKCIGIQLWHTLLSSFGRHVTLLWKNAEGLLSLNIMRSRYSWVKSVRPHEIIERWASYIDAGILEEHHFSRCRQACWVPSTHAQYHSRGDKTDSRNVLGMCDRVDIGIKVVECRVGEIEQGRALGVQNRKTDCPCSVPVWGVQSSVVTDPGIYLFGPLGTADMCKYNHVTYALAIY